MAEPSTTENPAGTGNNIPSGAPGPSPEPQSNVVKIREPFVIGGLTRWIEYIVTDESSNRTFGWRVREGSMVRIHGANLGIYNQARLIIDGKPFLHRGIERSTDGRLLSFRVTDEIKDYYKDGKLIVLELVDSADPANNRYLQERFRYRGETAQEERERRAKAAQSGAEAGQGAGKSTSISDVINATIGGVPEAIGKGFAAVGAAASIKKTGGATGGGSAQRTVSAGESGSEDVDYEQTEEHVSPPSAQELRQSVEIVGEHLDKNPGLIADTSVRTEVMQGLRSGNLANLSTQARTALQASVSGSVSSQTGAQAERVRSASEVINRQISFGAQASGQTEASSFTKATEGGQSRQDIAAEARQQSRSSAQARASAGVSASSTGAAGGQASAQAQASAQGQPPGAVSVPAQGRQTPPNQPQPASQAPAQPAQTSQAQLSRKQNLEIVGEYLDKNPQLIPNSKIRAEISGALGSGNIGQLSPEAKSTLDGALKNLSGGQTPAPPEVSGAAKQVLGQMPEQEASPAPDVSAEPAIPAAKSPAKPSAEPPAGVKGMMDKFSDNDAAVGSKLNSPARPNKDEFGPAGSPGAGSPLAPGGPGQRSGEPKPKGLDSVVPPEDNGQGGEQSQGGPGPGTSAKDGEQANPEAGEDSQAEEEEQTAPQIPVAAAAAAGPEAALGAKALNSALASGAAQEAVGEVTSQVWWYGFSSSAAFFFTGLDFFIGAAVMDVYWLSMHRRKPELFPMKGWQKAVTVLANLVPLILLAFFTAILMTIGCNYPVSHNSVTGYRASIIGGFIGDECKYFDASNLSAGSAAAH